MANTLTSVISTIYQAMDTVSRELVGFIPAVYRNSSAARAGKDQNITYPVVAAMSAADITPSATSSSGTDQTVGSGTMTISKSRKVSFNYTGEEQAALNNGDQSQRASILQLQFQQALRTLCNEVENDLWLAAYKGASRAYGTAATAPFGTAADFTDFAGVARILDDNGAPSGDRHLVVGAAAMANLRGKQSVLFKANEAGTTEFLRQGILGDVLGLMIHNSNKITTHTKGTGASYQLNGAGAVNDTALTVDTGSGTILAGDVITLATGSTSYRYVVNTALAANVVTIGKPGLRVAEADDNAITVGGTYTPNLAFDRMALHLVTRAPAMPIGGDEADDVIELTDPISGLAFQVALYRQYRQISYEVGLAWGVKAVKSEHIATLIG